LIEAHLLKPLRPQKSLALAIEQGGCGDPTGHTPRTLDGFTHQGFYDLPIGREKWVSGLGQSQVINLPAGASPVQPSGHDQSEGLGGLGGSSEKSQMDHRGLGQGGHNGPQQTLWQTEQQGALELGKERQKGGVLEQRKLPTLETLYSPAPRRGSPEPIHPKADPLDVFGTYGHSQVEGPFEGLRKQYGSLNFRGLAPAPKSANSQAGPLGLKWDE
jgi:hypothetical protein